MKSMNRWLGIAGVCALLGSVPVKAQEPASNSAPSISQDPAPMRGGQENGPRPTLGKITAIRPGVFDIEQQDGQKLTIKFTDQTDFRKDREKAAVGDFKVGDMVVVRGETNADHSVTAKVIASRSGAMGGGPGAGRGMQAMGTLGKDYVAGEVRAIDAPKLTVLRTDGVTQTIELNEETSLRKGRDSVTMADIQVGDHLMARGAVEKDMFVPKNVFVIGPEQWKRMQERGAHGVDAPPAGAAPKTQEQPN